ncbi:MAG: iron ABC transporter permease [Kiritimatiellae bacterium]|nr:iron ABC transporter permease [Kiritimatiellia bacterium]
MGQDIQALYREHLRRKVLLSLGLAAVLVVAAALSLGIGAYPLRLTDLIQALCGSGDGVRRHILLNIRLPRMAAALLAGGCLGLAGAAMQSVLRNPLASPFTLGVSQGAAFGAAFAIIVLGAGRLLVTGDEPLLVQSPHVIVLAAFLGSLITVAALLVLSACRDLSPAALILAGVALSSFFGAATMLLQYFASDIQVAAAVFWTFGDLGKARWGELGFMALALAPATGYLVWRRWHFNALLWGDDTAKSLGVAVYRLRILSLVLTALIASVATAFLGIIGFVGLIAPHIMRMILGQDHRFLFPCSMLAGGLLLLVSDALARTVLAPIVLPVGILTSFAGVPLFLYLLLKRGGLAS